MLFRFRVTYGCSEEEEVARKISPMVCMWQEKAIMKVFDKPQRLSREKFSLKVCIYKFFSMSLLYTWISYQTSLPLVSGAACHKSCVPPFISRVSLVFNIYVATAVYIAFTVTPHHFLDYSLD